MAGDRRSLFSLPSRIGQATIYGVIQVTYVKVERVAHSVKCSAIELTVHSPFIKDKPALIQGAD